MNDLKFYTIPGLGFDERVFSKLDFGKNEVGHLNWLEPKADESLQDYARRMAEGLESPGKKTVLVGHSLGGILAQEIAQFLPIEQIVLISSIKSRAEMPWHFRIVAPLGLWRFFTKSFVLKTFPLWAKTGGYVSPEEQTLFKSMISKQSDGYLKWALKNLSLWQTPTTMPTKIVQIHGQKDRNFPVGLIREPFFLLENGSHFMVFSQWKVVSDFVGHAVS